MAPETGPTAEARVPTASASRYLQQLCKHFQHRVPVELDERHGRIAFPSGTCELDADDTTLTLRAAASGQSALEELEGVVARHLERFAFRETLRIDWVRAPAEGHATVPG